MVRRFRRLYARLILAVVLVALAHFLVAHASAQEVDARADSLRVRGDSLDGGRGRMNPLESADPLRYAPPDSTPIPGGMAVDAGMWTIDEGTLILPVVSPALDLEHLLANVPGSFLYDLGAPGWPHGWSPDGLDPASIGLAAFGLSWNDAVTGRPRFDLLPMAFFEPLTLEPTPYGHAVGVTARLRTYAAPRPVTELRYWKGAGNLQSITATHAQRRRIWLFGGGDLSVQGGYGGRASDGEYAGSRLRRERHVLGRLRFERPGWHVELFDLHSRHHIGAHGGVLPRPGMPFESVFDRFGARVENERATRRTVRNDFVAETGLPFTVLGEQPLLRGFWTAQTFRYRDPADTLSVDTDRLGAILEHGLSWGGGEASLSASMHSERNAMNWLTEEEQHLEFHAVLRGSMSRGSFSTDVRQGIHVASGAGSSTSVRASYDGGRSGTFVHVAHGADPAALLHERGFGALVQPIADAARATTSLVRAGATFRAGPLSLGATVFASRTRNDVVIVPIAADTAAVSVVESVRRRGTTVELGLRARARRGFYLTATATSARLSGDEAFMDRLAESLPRLYGTARGGLRYRLFRGDLDLHAYVEARAWSAFRSRTFHAPTGLLILPEIGADELGPSSTISLYVEAGVRDATLFIAWENLAAGTVLMEGNLLVPVYPLPEQAFRFGVFWPIWD